LSQLELILTIFYDRAHMKNSMYSSFKHLTLGHLHGIHETITDLRTPALKLF